MRFIRRADWGARPPRTITGLDAEYGVTVHYEGPHLGPYDHASCPSKVRGIQSFHMDGRGWADIAYTDIICRHGDVFEGRGIDRRTAANGTNHGNDVAYAVCLLIGVDDEFTPASVDALVDIIAVLRYVGHAGRGVNGHRDWKATACPGDPVYDALPFIRRRLDDPPLITPAPPTGTPVDYGDVPMKRHPQTIRTGADGTGFADVNVDPLTVVSIVANVADPDPGPPGGAGSWPAGARPFRTGRLNHGGITRVVVSDAVPNGAVGVDVWTV